MILLALAACLPDRERPKEVDWDLDGFVGRFDCDDDRADVFPGAPETCDDVDNDCDGAFVCDAGLTPDILVGGPYSEAGSAVELGDFDQDGRADLLVGSATARTGAAATPNTGAVWLVASPVSGGDLVDLGTRLDGEFADNHAGERLAAPVDLTGDGVPDIVASARWWANGESTSVGDPYYWRGRVYVVPGPSPSAGGLLEASAATLSGSERDEQFGSDLATGLFDEAAQAGVVVGAMYEGDPRGSWGTRGAVYLFPGPLGGEGVEDLVQGDARAQVTGATGADLIGEAVAAVDLDQDGVDDVVAGGTGAHADCGDGLRPAVFAITGMAEGFLHPDDADRTWCSFRWPDAIGQYHSLSVAGDADGDGGSDLLIGQSVLGHAWIVLSSPVAPRAARLAEGAAARFSLGEGTQAWSAGDSDGDGTADLVATRRDGDFVPPGGPLEEGTGMLWLLTGPFSGDLDLGAATRTVAGPGVAAGFGADVAAGDVDADGRDDLVVSALGFSGGRGGVFVLRGGAW